MGTSSSELPQIPRSSFDFLKALETHNNRDWFNDHKTEFLQQQQAIEIFAGQLITTLNTHDLIETPSGKHSLHRIYRDTRFGTDKTPYRNHWSGSFRRATKYRRGGYYFHLEPGDKTRIYGGFQGPSAPDLKRIREDIAFDDSAIRKILNNRTFLATFEKLSGEQVKTAPKGFSKDDSAIDLLRYKQFLLIRNFTDEAVYDPSFFYEVHQTFKAMRPFFNYMSEVLTTDTNGLDL